MSNFLQFMSLMSSVFVVIFGTFSMFYMLFVLIFRSDARKIINIYNQLDYLKNKIDSLEYKVGNYYDQTRSDNDLILHFLKKFTDKFPDMNITYKEKKNL